MKPNSRQLALRDPALAAAMGILGTGQSNYGHEPARSQAPSFGNEFAGDSTYAEGYYGYHGDSVGFGYQGSAWGFGADAALAKPAGAAVPQAHPLHPAQAQRTMAIVAKHNAESARTAHRESLLHPNKGSRVDIERYDFSINQSPSLVLGTASTIAMSTQPAVTVRPQRCTFNAPSVGFAQISAILSANVNGLVGQSLDAGNYGPTSFGVHLDLPTLSPANKLQINGTYSGLVPTGFPIAFAFPFTASFQCPATVVA
jgi:hypothetical protein